MKGERRENGKKELLVGTQYLPQELVENILTRVPVKPLGQFRCVSKQWHTLLTDPIFIKKHISRMHQNDENHGLILKDYNKYYFIHNEEFENAVKLECGYVENLEMSRLEGSSNGVVCLSNESLVWLWNPTTRECKTLPPSLVGYNELFMELFGFGYDLATDDFKVVKLVNYDDLQDGKTIDNIHVEVYSLRMNSWRRLGAFPYRVSSVISSRLNLCGCLHWVGVRTDSLTADLADTTPYELIIAFDMATETFREIPMPDKDNFDPEDITGMDVQVFRGNLSLIAVVDYWAMDIWEMKDYGVQESWTYVFSLDIKENVWAPFHCLKNGDFLLNLENQVASYNTESEELIRIQVPDDVRACVDGISYVETLVQLDAA